MKTRELSKGEKGAILKLRKEGKSIRAIGQLLGIATRTFGMSWKGKKLLVTWATDIELVDQGTVVDEWNIVRAVKKTPKTCDIKNDLQSAGVKVSQSTVRRRLQENKYRGYTTRCKPAISSKNRKARLEFAKK